MSNDNPFTVGDVDFEAVRFHSPIPHWRPKIVETGAILEAGVFNSDSRPRMRDSISYFYDRTCKGSDNNEFRRNLKIPIKPLSMEE